MGCDLEICVTDQRKWLMFRRKSNNRASLFIAPAIFRSGLQITFGVLLALFLSSVGHAEGQSDDTPEPAQERADSGFLDGIGGNKPVRGDSYRSNLTPLSAQKELTFFFAGHAYGAPVEVDEKIHPPLKNNIEFINSKNVDFGIFGGDFIQNCESVNEWNNFKEFSEKFSAKIYHVLGNHEKMCENSDQFFKKVHGSTFYKEKINNNLFLFLDTNFNNTFKIPTLLNFVKNNINDNMDVDNIFLFSHQVAWSKSIWDIRTNSRQYYNKSNIFYDEIIGFLNSIDRDVYWFSGDVGAFRFQPYLTYHEKQNVKLISSGMGNYYNDNLIFITIGKNIKISPVNLNNGQNIDLYKHSSWYVFFYQLPKLILFEIKTFIISTVGLLFLLSILTVLSILYLYKTKINHTL